MNEDSEVMIMATGYITVMPVATQPVATQPVATQPIPPPPSPPPAPAQLDISSLFTMLMTLLPIIIIFSVLTPLFEELSPS
ncbi:MAG: hypothetical protein QXF17_02725 [Ignisphaera sp.]